MKKNIILFATVAFMVFPGTCQQSIDTYFGANSLVHHIVQVNPTPTQETSAPHWMRFIAQAAGNNFTVSGDFTALPFLTTQNQIPLENTWTFDSVPSGWDSWSTPFGQSPIDNVIFTPFNFVQHRRPFENYEFGDTSLSPITASDTLISWVIENKPGTAVYIYEGWPDMGPFTGGNFPPTPTEWNNYQDYAGYNGTYHDWFLELHDSLINRFPNACVKLIPVGPIISELLDQAPYNTLAIDSLYEDDAPHGRPSIYLIAGLITYMAIYQEIAPSAYQPPIEFIDSTIIAEYPNLVNIIWSQLLAFNDPNGSSRVFCNLSAGINQNPNEVSLNVYPNPARSYVHINSSISEGTVILRDAMGRILVEQNLNPTIRVDQIPSGYYFVEIYDTQLQKRAMKRIVIQ